MERARQNLALSSKVERLIMTSQEKEIRVTLTQRLKKHFWFIIFISASIFLYVWYTKECPQRDIKVFQTQKEIAENNFHVKEKVCLTPNQVLSLRSSIRLLQGSGFKVVEIQPGNYYRNEHSYIMLPENIYNAIKTVRSYGYYAIHRDDIDYDQSKDFFIRIMKNE